MNRRLHIYIAIFLCSTGALNGSAFGDQPLPIVQVCLGNERNLPAFVSMMQSIAQSENMKFIDGSEQTQKDLESIGEVIREAKPTGPVINIGVEREDGMGVTAGNLGLPKNQIALGFSKGGNLPEAQKFADVVVQSLEERWHVEVLPPNIGAQGMKTCTDQPEDTL